MCVHWQQEDDDTYPQNMQNPLKETEDVYWVTQRET